MGKIGEVGRPAPHVHADGRGQRRARCGHSQRKRHGKVVEFLLDFKVMYINIYIAVN